MTRRPSIALRLALGLTTGMALLWIGAAAISVSVMQHELNEAYDDSLEQSAQRLLPLAVHDLRERGDGGRLVGGAYNEGGDDDDRPDAGDGPAGSVPHDSSFTYVVFDSQGVIMLRDQQAADFALPADLPEGFADIDGQRTFGLTDRNGFSILIVETSDRRLNGVMDAISALGFPLLALLPLMAGGVWLAMRLALRPLEALRRDIAKRDSKNLEPLLSDGHPAELAPIAEAVGALMSRLKSALDAERSFAARSAHELRTPIAGALAQTQQLAAELGNGPGAARLVEIEAALKKLAKLSEKLLQLARVEAGFARSDREADLLPVLNMVVHDFNASTLWHDRVHVDAAGGGVVAAIDPDAFAIALRNLIENALKHGAAGQPVQVIAAAAGAVRIVNQGGLVGAADLARLGQPFARGDTAADGNGLGLSIARSILEQAGGSLSLQSPASGAMDGFEAVMVLPRGDNRQTNHGAPGTGATPKVKA
ncbi:sensor histidine kinase [Devosia sp. SL43]|uniref:sensor histidine kinase n=1 Tax=Devosia sp. SL43 TaxID=2806348 RepID=UPI001F3FEF1F|nr:HAMP domain-containing sensor histidine kinase [Devosia sp. SL43]UJW85009.1 HAMP domain-containing histidine kinase [Devosia sp. SL43]